MKRRMMGLVSMALIGAMVLPNAEPYHRPLSGI